MYAVPQMFRAAFEVQNQIGMREYSTRVDVVSIVT